MANQKRAEVEIRLNGEVHVLRFGFNELCELEGLLDCSLQDMVTKRNASFLRACLFVGMRKRNRKMAIEEAGNMLYGLSIGEREEHTLALADALMLAYTGKSVEEITADSGADEAEQGEAEQEPAPLTGTSC